MSGGVSTLRKPRSRSRGRSAPHELAGGEVAVARRDVVEQDPGDVAVAPDQHDADGLVALLDLEREVVVVEVVAAKPGW